MELLLWRWSTLAQSTSDLMIAVFFVALARSVRRSELRVWVAAWLANLAALSIVIAFWLLAPPIGSTFAVIGSLYLFAKTLFVLLIVDGAIGFANRRAVRTSYLKPVVALAVLSSIAGFTVRSVDQLGIVQEALIAGGLGACAVFLVSRRVPGNGWLATGFALRALFAIAAASAYAMDIAANGAPPSEALATFISTHSIFDTGAEWVIALGCVLTLYGTIQNELTQSNRGLQGAQAQLQALLDRDQLTGVFNRRALPTMLLEAQVTGATILFFDLDEFKKVNDIHGHQAGDACLVHFAWSVQESFPASDRVIRYAGDEFVVLAQSIDPAAIAVCIQTLRETLQSTPIPAQRITFSVGGARLAAGGDPEEALRKADEAMYATKGVPLKTTG
jgi:diguanylate cyclase (GGDEF)-like protein